MAMVDMVVFEYGSAIAWIASPKTRMEVSTRNIMF